MADKHRDDFSCQDLAANSGLDDFFILSIEISILVALSHLLHFFFKRFNQPSILSQMFAGLLVGRSCLRRLISSNYKIDDDSHLISMASIGGTFFMFLVGLEMDFRFLMRSIRAASFITLGNTVTSIILASIVGPIIYGEIGINGGQVLFVFILAIIFANTASPVLIHMMAELKMTMSEVGRLGISAALINDVTCLVIIGVVILFPMPNEGKRPGEKFVEGLEALILIVASAGILRVIAQLINRISKKRRVIQEEYIWLLVSLVIAVTMLSDKLGYPSIMPAFVMGLVFPREGPAIRTITGSMRFGVNTFILPIYFGYAGVQTNLFMLRDKIVLITVGIIVVCGTVGKVISTFLVAKHLRMQVQEGVVLGFLLTVKGHVELIVITLGRQYGIFSKEIYQALLISMIFNNMTTGPTASYFARRERCAVKHQPVGLEFLDLDRELRIIFCVHSPHDIPTVLDLLQISTATNRDILVPYLLHLVEFADPTPSSSPSSSPALYNQLQNNTDNLNGGQNARLVNACVDMFKREAKIQLRQLTAISALATLHKHTCNRAKDLRAAMIVVPYHRKTRFDGKMGAGKSSVREFNVNVLQRARCTVGILVDRGLECSAAAAGEEGEDKKDRVVVMFLGGPDDREAVAYGIRLAMNPSVSVTVVRFLMVAAATATAASGSGESEVLGSDEGSVSSGYGNCDAMMEVKGAPDPDEEFMADVRNRFVSTRAMKYEEKIVEKSEEMLNEIISMEGRYSLFIVGRQRQGPTSRLTMGMSESEADCQELGVIGNLLASSNFISTGSVLVVQQYCKSRATNFSVKVVPSK